MAKAKYIARVVIESGVEETRFEPQGDAPAIPAAYEGDPKKFGKYKTGESVTFGSDELAEIAVAPVEASAPKTTGKKASK